MLKEEKEFKKHCNLKGRFDLYKYYTKSCLKSNWIVLAGVKYKCVGKYFNLICYKL